MFCWTNFVFMRVSYRIYDLTRSCTHVLVRRTCKSSSKQQQHDVILIELVRTTSVFFVVREASGARLLDSAFVSYVLKAEV